MNFHVTFVDFLVVAVVVVSAIFATWRGFVSETLSVFAWAAAAFATLWFGPWVAGRIGGLLSPEWLGRLAGYALVFLVVLIPLSFISYRFSEGVKKSPISALDRSLGLMFGVVRGLAIVGIAYLIFSSFVRVPDQPDWIKDARLYPVIQGAGEVLASLAPPSDRHFSRDLTELRHHSESAETMDIAPPREKSGRETAYAARHDVPMPHPRPQDAKNRHKTYGAKDREALDKLIEATGSGDSGKP